VAAAEAKRAAEARDRQRRAEEVAAAMDGAPAIVHLGGFRDVARDHLADGSVSLIYTDPPYDRGSLPLYGALALVAQRVLRPGGSLLCYCGQYLLPDILPLMTPHLRFHWFCACIHTGELARMWEYGVVVGWKPILWFTKGQRSVAEKQVFVEDAVRSG